jgi:hypothetical protein
MMRPAIVEKELVAKMPDLAQASIAGPLERWRSSTAVTPHSFGFPPRGMHRSRWSITGGRSPFHSCTCPVEGESTVAPALSAVSSRNCLYHSR